MLALQIQFARNVAQFGDFSFCKFARYKFYVAFCAANFRGAISVANLCGSACATNLMKERIKMEALFLLVWPLVIYLSYKFTRLNINQLEKLEKI